MKGTVVSFLLQKGYGFIKGDDGKSYFFHVSALKNKADVGLLDDGVTLSFEQEATPKCYQAVAITVLQTSKAPRVNSLPEVDKDREPHSHQQLPERYKVPDDIITSKHDDVRGWETLEVTEKIFTSSDPSMDKAKDKLFVIARRYGANALLNLRYDKSTDADGNYRFSVHHFSAQLASVGRLDPQGTKTRDALLGINQRIAEDERAKQKQQQTALVAILMVIATFFLWLLVF